MLQDASSSSSSSSISSTMEQGRARALFDDFVEFLIQQQTAIIDEIESTIELSSPARFCRDTWGCFDDNNDPTNKNENNNNKSGGITRVLQGGDCIEKGACSLTLIGHGILTAERAANIRARQSSVAGDGGGEQNDTLRHMAQAGETYSAAALSMVLHSRSPLVPTFRSDVRVFLVTDQETQESSAWFGESFLPMSVWSMDK